MITEKDLQEAIAECLGQRSPNANTCIKLAAYYTIQQNLFPGTSTENVQVPSSYSFAAPPVEQVETVKLDSDSEFSQMIGGRDVNDVLRICDELMNTLKLINPRLYDGVIRKLLAL